MLITKTNRLLIPALVVFSLLFISVGLVVAGDITILAQPDDNAIFNGNVGIGGITNPFVNLDVANGARVQGAVQISQLGNQGSRAVVLADDHGNLFSEGLGTLSIPAANITHGRFGAAAGDLQPYSFAGNLGIKVSNPIEALEVAGNIRINNNKIYLSSSGNASYLDKQKLMFGDDGVIEFGNAAYMQQTQAVFVFGGSDFSFIKNVGIGTTPTSTLDIKSNGSSATNLKIRSNANQGLNSFITLSDSSGATSYLDMGTTCAGDILLGTGAGQSLPASCGAGGTIFMGKNAGQDVSNVSSANVFIGANAGIHITTGNSSVAIGPLAGSSYTGYGTVSNNAAVGYQALANSGGSNSVGLGYQAGYNPASAGGSNNTFLGAQAGMNITGNSNVFVGSQAGSGLSPVSSNNIIIGAGVAGSGYITNTLIIDNSNTAPALIYGDMANNRLGINTASVGTYTLNIGGSLNATSYYAGGTQGTSKTVVVRNQAGTGTCNLVFNNGLFISSTCP